MLSDGPCRQWRCFWSRSDAGEGPSQTPPPDRQDAAQADGAAPGSGPPAADRTLQHGGQVTSDGGQVTRFSPGPHVQMVLQEDLILAEPGAVIHFEEGPFDFTSGLSLDVDNVTIRGRGMDKTILVLQKQQAAPGALYQQQRRHGRGSGHRGHQGQRHQVPYGGSYHLPPCAHRMDRRTAGDQRRLLGIYPVSSKQVLIEECVAIAASDAGIYVGQSQDAIIRGCRAEYNVAGIEIENCYRAKPTATSPRQHGRHTRFRLARSAATRRSRYPRLQQQGVRQ